MSPVLGAGVTLVLGGVRSGKSAFAERLVEERARPQTYIATGRAWDEEMRERIETHRRRRGDRWVNVEAPLELRAAIEKHARPDRILLVDCLTLWLTNLMLDERAIEVECEGFVAALKDAGHRQVVLVSNEVGLGIIPENRMSREFADHAGTLHQKIADLAGAVYFVAAGLPLTLKG